MKNKILQLSRGKSSLLPTEFFHFCAVQAKHVINVARCRNPKNDSKNALQSFGPQALQSWDSPCVAVKLSMMPRQSCLPSGMSTGTANGGNTSKITESFHHSEIMRPCVIFNNVKNTKVFKTLNTQKSLSAVQLFAAQIAAIAFYHTMY